MIKFPKEDIFVFSDVGNWLGYGELDGHLYSYLAPHSFEYFSSLNSLFLFRVKDTDKLNVLDHVLVRDGALPLMKFFWDNPFPKGFYSSLIIPENLSFLVPSSWLDNVYYYRDRTISSYNNNAKRNTLVVTGMARKECLDLDQVFTNLEKIVQNKNIHEVLFCIYHNKWRSHDMHCEDDGTYFKLVKGFSKVLNDKVHFVRWEELSEKLFANAYFWDLSTYPFFYSDSFVKHYALSNGAELIPTEVDSVFNDVYESYIEELSPYHGYEIFSGKSNADQSIRDVLGKEIQALSYVIGDREKTSGRTYLGSSQPQMCTDDLKAFTQKVCRKYLPRS